MNERIRLLAEQCYETGPIGKDGWPEYSKFNEEKFAELIVWDCIEAIDAKEYTMGGIQKRRECDSLLTLLRNISELKNERTN